MADTTIHPSALCECRQMGQGVQVGAFASVAAGAVLADLCDIGAFASIGGDVQLAEQVRVGLGARLSGPLRIGAQSLIGANAVLGAAFGGSGATTQATRLGVGVQVGAGAVVCAGLELGTGAVLAAGAVVTQHVPAHAIVEGNPAVITGYVTAAAVNLGAGREEAALASAAQEAAAVDGVRLLDFTYVQDLRGNLAAAQAGDQLPFAPQRIFMVHQVPNAQVRGEHAHRVCAQILVAVSGAVSVMVDDGVSRAQYRLRSPAQGLYLPPMVWGVQHSYSADAVLLVLASHTYDAADYIRNYDEFVALRATPHSAGSH